MRRRKRTKNDAERKEWLRQADQWDGTAYVYDPVERRYEEAGVYKATMCDPMMRWFDRQPTYERRRLANSVDGFGTEAPTIRR